MSDALRKLVLLFLIACLPLQGLAAGVMALSHHGRQTAQHDMSTPMDGDMHGCCHHDHDTSPAQPQSSCGDGAHCPLCNVLLVPDTPLMLGTAGNSSLYPTSSPHISLFYPEQPQRPPLVRLS
jgi:hypothetical protein